jgi:hypothetical protein
MTTQLISLNYIMKRNTLKYLKYFHMCNTVVNTLMKLYSGIFKWLYFIFIIILFHYKATIEIIGLRQTCCNKL